MGPRVYTATRPSQTDPFSSPKPEKKVSIISSAQPTTNGHIANGKQNGSVAAERPKELDLSKAKEKDQKIDMTILDTPDGGDTKLIDLPIEKDLERSKFGSLRSNVEAGNYVRLSDPLSVPDQLHYERELAQFNEKYLRDYLDNVAGRLPVKEDYLPELQTPAFAKVKAGRARAADHSPRNKSPSRARTVPAPTIQQLEDYLRSSGRSRRSDTPVVFPMEPIEERDREGDAAGTPTDPGYVQYAARRWPDDSRRVRTPRHSPTQ